MDALAQGYGTDSSEESSKPAPKATLGLLANYSDDSDVEEDKVKNGGVVGADATNTKAPHEAGKATASTSATILKKRRINGHDELNLNALAPGLPPPKLLSQYQSDNSSNNKSTVDKFSGTLDHPNIGILCRKNYLEGKLRYNNTGTLAKILDPKLCEKLNQLYENSISNTSTSAPTSASSFTSFAQQLKSQKEFGNPHTFPSIIANFGIDPMESNIQISSGDGDGDGDGGGERMKFERFEFLERLIVKEEENRVRQGQAQDQGQAFG